MVNLRGCLHNVTSMGGTLEGREHREREILLGVTGVIAAYLCYAVPEGLVRQDTMLITVAQTLALLPNAVIMYRILLWKDIPKMLILLSGFSCTLCIICADLFARGVGNINWPLFVVVADFFLVMRVDNVYTITVVLLMVAWLLIAMIESATRMGIYDIPGTASQKLRREHWEQLTDCDTLPCTASVRYVYTTGLTSVILFVADFATTRGFANQVIKERAAMEITIRTVQEIAVLLSEYDIDAVAEKLKHCELPEQMHATLAQMEENLRRYKPYLPIALFDAFHDSGQNGSVSAPPGVVAEYATIVFTDIRASTFIWENEPTGMRIALRIHNAVLRAAIAVFHGYEVKTIGDAFMVAFNSTSAGVAFGLRTLEDLFRAEWPSSILGLPICAPVDALWSGLNVRIGVNSGPITTEQNVLTGRTDYFGHTVNVAARLESSCTPGAVAIPYALWVEDCHDVDAVAGKAQTAHLRGVSDHIVVCSLWPPSLSRRAQHPLLEPPGCAVSPLRSVGRMVKPEFTPVLATLGVVELVAEGNDALVRLSSGLGALTTSLDQSGGSMVSILGCCVCVGWNLSRATHAHVECGVRFAQRIDPAHIRGAGLASGMVQHGDVGSRTQRFLTVVGSAVHRSWTLCEESVSKGQGCLYSPPEGTVLPSALSHFFVPLRNSVYELIH